LSQDPAKFQVPINGPTSNDGKTADLEVFGTSETNSFVTVRIGSILATRQDIRDPGLVEIRLDDQSQPLLAFTRDITERTEAVDERARAATVSVRG